MGGKVSVAEEVARGASAVPNVRTISVRPIPADGGDTPFSSRSDVADEERHNGAVLTPLQAQVMSWQRKFCNDGYFDASPASDIMDYLEQDALADLARFVQQGLEPRKPTRWKRGELLGSGAYGRVYLGLNEEDGTLMAAKQIPLHGLDDANELILSMEREIRLMSRLHHPNIVQYLGSQRDEYIGAGVREEYLTIFMEYVPGGSIASLLKRFGKLNETVVRLYTKQLVYGLAYLHAHAVVHRDIKGGNVLVDRSGVCKLSDFGASKSLTDLEDGTMVGGGGMGPKSLKGTPAFMSPEVIRQTGYGRKSDIWSIGCTVIEMSTGRAPWSNYDNPVAAMFAIAVSADMPKMPDDMTPEGVAFLQLCFQRDPALRPTAAELLRHPFLTGEACAVAGDSMLKVESSSSGMSALASPTTPPLVAPSVPSGGSSSSVASGATPDPVASTVQPVNNPYSRRHGVVMRNSTSSEGPDQISPDNKPHIVTTSQPASALDPVLESAATSSSGGSFTVPSKPAPIVIKASAGPGHAQSGAVARSSASSAPTVTGIHQSGTRATQHKHSSSTPSRLEGGFSDLDAIAAAAATDTSEVKGARAGLTISATPSRAQLPTTPVLSTPAGSSTPGVGIHGRRRDAPAAVYVVPPHSRSASTGSIASTAAVMMNVDVQAATTSSTQGSSAPASTMPGLWGSRRAKGALPAGGSPAASVVVLPPARGSEPGPPAHGRRSEPASAVTHARPTAGALSNDFEDAVLDKVRSAIDDDIRATVARLKETDRDMYKSYRVAFFEDSSRAAAAAQGGRRPSDPATSRPTVNVLAGNAVPWGASPSPLPVGRAGVVVQSVGTSSSGIRATVINPTLTVVAPPHHRQSSWHAVGQAAGSSAIGTSGPPVSGTLSIGGRSASESSINGVSGGGKGNEVRRDLSESVSPVMRGHAQPDGLSPRAAATTIGGTMLQKGTVASSDGPDADLRTSPASSSASTPASAPRSTTPAMTAPSTHSTAAAAVDALQAATHGQGAGSARMGATAPRAAVASMQRSGAMQASSSERERADTTGSVDTPMAGTSLAFRRTSESLASAGSTAMLPRAPLAPVLAETGSTFRSSTSTLGASAAQMMGSAGSRRAHVSIVTPPPAASSAPVSLTSTPSAGPLLTSVSMTTPRDGVRQAAISRTSSVPASLVDATSGGSTPADISSRLALVKERSAAVSSAPSRRPRVHDTERDGLSSSSTTAVTRGAVMQVAAHARAETAPDLMHDADLTAALSAMNSSVAAPRSRPPVASYSGGGRG